MSPLGAMCSEKVYRLETNTHKRRLSGERYKNHKKKEGALWDLPVLEAVRH